MNIVVSEFVPKPYDYELRDREYLAKPASVEYIPEGSVLYLPAGKDGNERDEYYLVTNSGGIHIWGTDHDRLDPSVPSSITIYEDTYTTAGIPHAHESILDPTIIPYTNVFRGICQDYISLVWTEKMYAPGEFTLALLDTPENRELFQPERWLSIDPTKSSQIMIIEKVEFNAALKNDGYLMTVTGRSLSSILDRRVAFPGFSLNTSECTANGGFFYGINKLVEAYFIDPGLVVAEDAISSEDSFYYPERRIDPLVIGRDIEHQFPETGEIPHNTINATVSKVSILEAIQTRCKDNNFGFTIDYGKDDLGREKLIFKLYQGLNRTQESDHPLYFSPLMDNVDSVAVTDDISEYKNFIFCAKEKEGNNYIDMTAVDTVDASSLLGDVTDKIKGVSTIKNWIKTNLQDNNITRTAVMFIAVAASQIHSGVGYDNTVVSIKNSSGEEWPKDGSSEDTMDYVYPSNFVEGDWIITYKKIVGGSSNSPEASFRTVSTSDTNWAEAFKQSTAFGWLTADILTEAKTQAQAMKTSIIGTVQYYTLRAWFTNLDRYTSSYSQVRYLCGTYNSGEPGTDGLKRREVFVEGEEKEDETWTTSDIMNWRNFSGTVTPTKEDDEESDEEVVKRLQKTAVKKSGEYMRKHDVDAKCNGDTTKYIRDYKLGDIVRVDDAHGSFVNYMISETTISDDTSKGLQVIPTFEKYSDIPSMYTKLDWLAVSNMILPIKYNQLSKSTVETEGVKQAESGTPFGASKGGHTAGLINEDNIGYEDILPFTSYKDREFKMTEISFEAAHRSNDGTGTLPTDTHKMAIISADGLEVKPLNDYAPQIFKRDYPMMVVRDFHDRNKTSGGTALGKATILDNLKYNDNNGVSHGGLVADATDYNNTLCYKISGISDGEVNDDNSYLKLKPGCGYTAGQTMSETGLSMISDYGTIPPDELFSSFELNKLTTDNALQWTCGLFGAASAPFIHRMLYSNNITMNECELQAWYGSGGYTIYDQDYIPNSHEIWVNQNNNHAIYMGDVKNANELVRALNTVISKAAETPGSNKDSAICRYIGTDSSLPVAGVCCMDSTIIADNLDENKTIPNFFINYVTDDITQTDLNSTANLVAYATRNGYLTEDKTGCYVFCINNTGSALTIYMDKEYSITKSTDTVKYGLIFRTMHNPDGELSVGLVKVRKLNDDNVAKFKFKILFNHGSIGSSSVQHVQMFYDRNKNLTGLNSGDYIAISNHNLNSPYVGNIYRCFSVTETWEKFTDMNLLKSFLTSTSETGNPGGESTRVTDSKYQAMAFYPRVDVNGYYSSQGQIKWAWLGHYDKNDTGASIATRTESLDIVRPFRNGTYVPDYESNEDILDRYVILGGYRYAQRTLRGDYTYSFDSDFTDNQNGYAFKTITVHTTSGIDRNYTVCGVDFDYRDQAYDGQKFDQRLNVQLFDKSTRILSNQLVPVKYNGADDDEFNKLSDEQKYGFYDKVNNMFIPIDYNPNGTKNVNAKFCAAGPELVN